MSGVNFFYTFTREDQQARLLFEGGKIDPVGHVIDPVIDENLFNLNEAEEAILLATLQAQENVRSRKAEYIGKLSLEEIAQATQEAALSLHVAEPKLMIKGSALIKLLERRIIQIYETWSKSQITPLFKSRLAAKLNDVDSVFCIEGADRPSLIRRVIKEGLVKKLTINFQNQKINPVFIALKLAHAHQQAAKSFPLSYPHETARCQGKLISTKDPELSEKYIELCAFFRAWDGSIIKDREISSERVLKRGEFPLDDLTFTNKIGNTTTPIHALFIDITSLVTKKHALKIAIQSVLGPAKRLQSVCDQVLGNLTFDPSQEASPTDFARAVSHFTMGGRSYESGGLDKSMKAMKQEAERKKIPLPEMLASQLISRTKYHHGDHAATLIALTFNASALLFWKNMVW